MVIAIQLELDLWQELNTAMQKPEAADMRQLWLEVEVAIASVAPESKLLVAAEAIFQIVEIYVKRANAILDGLEVKDTSTGPVLSEDFLSGLMRQSMTIDLEDLMEEDLLPLSRTQTTREETVGSVVAPVNKETAREMARQARNEMKQMLAQLAEKENASQWAEAIAHWLQQHSLGRAVSLLKLQQALEMPLVEVWLGLLLSNQQHYKWKQQGEFYSDAKDFWLAV